MERPPGPRRHQRAPGHPSNSTATASPLIAIQSHSDTGAGSPATPIDVMYQYDSAVVSAATPSATGSAQLRQRLRHPIAVTATISASAWTAGGNQPCSKDSSS